MKSSEVENSFEELKQGKSSKISEHVNVRLIRQEDFNELVEMLNNPSINKYLFYAPAPAEAFEGFFHPMIEAAKQAIDNNEWPDAACLIFRDHNDNFLGNAGLAQSPFLVGNFEIGFHIAKNASGKGLATMAAKFVRDIAFNHLSAYKLCADCYGGNIGSTKVLEKAGFVKEGRQESYYDNKDDKLIYGLNSTQYLASHSNGTV